MSSNDDVSPLLARAQQMQTPEGTLALAAELLRVRSRDGHLLPLVANRAQQQFEQQRGQRNIILKARQMGMTTWIAARFFLRTITQRGVLTVQVAQSQQAVEMIFSIVQRMWANLPDDLRKGPLRRSRANRCQMRFPELDSEFRVWSAADRNAGRGLSMQNLHCSEVSRWPGDAQATLAGLRAALAPGGELVLESTPNGAAGAFYNEWQSAVEPGLTQPCSDTLVRHFFPWWMEPAYSGAPVSASEMTAEENALVAAHKLTAAQIGFRRTLAQGFGALRTQEFAEDATTCFRTSGDCCFDLAAIDEQMLEARMRHVHDRRRNGALLVWLPPVARGRYIVAVDSAGGGADGDFAAVQVIDAHTGMQCAELQERLPPLELAREARLLAAEYNNALVVVERNNHGSAVLAHLTHTERYANLYADHNGAGWLTTVASKPEMVGALGALLVDRPMLFASERLLLECRTFVRGRTGAGAATPGAHDDLVMSMSLAQLVRLRRVYRAP